MKKAAKSLRTKQQLAAALKTVMREQPIQRVHIHELTDICDIHRQSFYYHFEDVFALLRWSLQQDIEAHFRTQDISWQERLKLLLNEIARNRNYSLAFLDTRLCLDEQLLFRTNLAAMFRDELCSQNHGNYSPPFSSPGVAMLVAMCYSTLEQWAHGTLSQSADEIMQLFEAFAADIRRSVDVS